MLPLMPVFRPMACKLAGWGATECAWADVYGWQFASFVVSDHLARSGERLGPPVSGLSELHGRETWTRPV